MKAEWSVSALMLIRCLARLITSFRRRVASIHFRRRSAALRPPSADGASPLVLLDAMANAAGMVTPRAAISAALPG